MFHGVLALLTRSLRQDARQLKNHVFRLTFVAFIYLALLQNMLFSSFVGAPGLHFFISIAILNAVFITCAGIGFFATAISEEKEEEVIGLLMMAGLNPLGILLGKSTSRLIQAAFLLLVQFPFMLLAVTLGGVTPHQILAAYASLLAFMVMLANIALLWSTVCRRGGSAAAMTTICLAIYAAAPQIASVILMELNRAGAKSPSPLITQLLTSCENSCSYWRLGQIMTTGFAEPVISVQVISNLAIGIGCFLLSWVLFTPFNSQTTGASDSRGMVAKSAGRVRLFSPGRAWALPLVWKDFQFVAGGFRFAAVKFTGYVLLFAAIVYGCLQSKLSWVETTSLYATVMVWAVAIEASILASRIFHDEIRLQTMSSLMMLPRNLSWVGYSKALGCLVGLVPSIICLCVSTLLLPGLDLKIVFQFAISPVTWGAVLLFVVFLHLVALLSLFVKWGALPLGFVMMAPIMTCCPVLQLIFMISNRRETQDLFSSLIGTGVVWTLMGLVCFVFQMMIVARLQEIGSR